MKAFFKEKGLYLICLGLVFAATVTGILAIRSVVRNVGELTQARQNAVEEQSTWQTQDSMVNNPVEDLPESTPRPSAMPSASPSAQESSSGASSQSAAAQPEAGGSAAPSAPQAVSPVQPADSDPIAAFSGDELTYNATLGDWRTHNGADYAAEAGAQIPSLTAGTVTGIYEDALWGGVVELVDRSGALWRYCGLEETAVEDHDTVRAGDVLGTLGTVPSEADGGSHLHLEVMRDGAWLDPETLK